MLKIRSGKGDEIFINNGLGKNLFIETLNSNLKSAYYGDKNNKRL